MPIKLVNPHRAVLLVAGLAWSGAMARTVDDPWQWRPLETGGVDAAISWNHTHAFLFKGPRYSRYEIKEGKVNENYPKPIKWNWRELWSEGVDAAVYWSSGKALFFREREYIRYDTKKNRIDSGYPKRIAGNWPGPLKK